MDRGAWQATVPKVAMSQIRLKLLGIHKSARQCARTFPRP